MSTDAQLKGDSLRRQVELSRKYAEKHGLRLVDFPMQDIGISAFKGLNVAAGALGRFLHALDAGEIEKGSYLLVESLDRLTRQELTAAVELFLGIVRRGVTIVTLLDEHVYQTDKLELADMMMSIVFMGRAHEESATKSRRLAAAWAAKRERASDQKLTKICPAWLRLADDRSGFVDVPERTQVVRRIFEMTLDGHGAHTVARRLNQEGVPPFRRGNGWHESYIQKVLTNRAVLGEYQPHSKAAGPRVPVGEAIADYYPRVVDDQSFMAVAALRRARRGKGGRKGKALTNLFSHLATCAYCGSPMVLDNKGEGLRYLRCTGAKRAHRCASKGWRYEPFETSVLYFLHELNLAKVLTGADEVAKSRRAAEELAAAEELIVQLEGQRDKVFELIKLPGIDAEYVGRQLKAIADQLASAEGAREAAKASGRKAKLPKLSERGIKELIAKAQDIKAEGILDTRQRLADSLKSIVTSLKVGTEGRLPLLTVDSPQPGEPNPDLDALLEDDGHGVWWLRNPFFEIGLAADRSRTVVVSTDSPTTLIQLEEWQHGTVIGRRDLKPDGTSNRTSRRGIPKLGRTQ